MVCRVKWADVLSDEFDVPLGTKQGGISSPGFFSLYINDMVELLRKKGVGCHIINMFLACILFADDLALLAPTRNALQIMINACKEYCDIHCLSFNAKKSKVMQFGKAYNDICIPLKIGNCDIDFVSERKYFGTTISSGKTFSFSAKPDIASFFRASNAILSVLGDANEHVLLKLLYTNFVSILTYACNIKQYSASDMSDCNVAINNALRRIFDFKDWRSIRTLREVFQFKSIYETFKLAQDRFTASCQTSTNPMFRFIASL